MKKYILVLVILFAFKAFGGKISMAYKALSIYDYFKARELFYASLTKNPAEAGYGLATMYYRNDNPFSNIDSAAKYIAKSAKMFKDTVTLSGYVISWANIGTLSHLVSLKGFGIHSRHKDVCDLNYFLQQFYFSSDSLLNEAFLMRDRLSLKVYNDRASSDSMLAFLLGHPESQLHGIAEKKYYDLQYKEQIKDNTDAADYKKFITGFPKNPNVSDAESRLFWLTTQLHSPDSLYSFIKQYSKLSLEQAWRLLYSISVKNASPLELSGFLTSYADYPYRSEIEKEIQLSQQIVYVLKSTTEKYGYADSSGTWIIQPVFDDASEFREGFAGVCKNDSCYFINKSGEKTSELSFEETFDYHNGIAIVKKQNRYYLINRSGQLITKGFEDISPASDNLFTGKQNGSYGAINYKAETVIPFTYKKLGIFKNGYAYYLTDKYGLVSSGNKTLQARWDWISEIDTNNLVIVKKGLKFGLMNLDEHLLLEPEFDYINHCINGIYLAVKNGLYGFYNASGTCYMTDVAFDYDKGFGNAYYTNGKQFKLIEGEDVALADANGRISINFGAFTDVFFAKNDIIRIQKGKKFGYVDRKLKPVSPAEYDKASDFENEVATASKSGMAMLINKSGKAIFTLKDGSIEKQEGILYKTTLGDLSGLITNAGEVLLPNEYTQLEPVSKALWTAVKNNTLYLYKIKQKLLLKVGG
jgi:hypothetical protein